MGQISLEEFERFREEYMNRSEFISLEGKIISSSEGPDGFKLRFRRDGEETDTIIDISKLNIGEIYINNGDNIEIIVEKQEKSKEIIHPTPVLYHNKDIAEKENPYFTINHRN